MPLNSTLTLHLIIYTLDPTPTILCMKLPLSSAQLHFWSKIIKIRGTQMQYLCYIIVIHSYLNIFRSSENVSICPISILLKNNLPYF